MEDVIAFIEAKGLHRYHVRGGKRELKRIIATGGGAHKYADLFLERLGVVLEKVDEMDCLVGGCSFLLRAIHHEAFTFENGATSFVPTNGDKELYPYLFPGTTLHWLREETTPACASRPTSTKSKSHQNLDGQQTKGQKGQPDCGQTRQTTKTTETGRLKPDKLEQPAKRRQRTKPKTKTTLPRTKQDRYGRTRRRLPKPAHPTPPNQILEKRKRLQTYPPP